MVKFTVKHACGHEVSHAMPDGMPDRRKREAWLRQRPCQTCWQREQATAADARRREWNLPDLEGTEEDKAWADVIRMKAITHNREFWEKLSRSAGFRAEQVDMREALAGAAANALAELEEESSAAWWIENRFNVLGHVKQRVVAAAAPVLRTRDDR